MTTGGPASGSTCVFPFTYSGVTYNACADWIYGGQAAGTTWCSTKVMMIIQGVPIKMDSGMRFVS